MANGPKEEKRHTRLDQESSWKHKDGSNNEQGGLDALDGKQNREKSGHVNFKSHSKIFAGRPNLFAEKHVSCYPQETSVTLPLTLRMLSENTQTKDLVIKDQAMLGALVKFLKSEEEDIKTEALEVLLILASSTEEHKVILTKEAGLLAVIKKEMRSVESSERSRQLATDIFGELQSAVKPQPVLGSKKTQPKTYTLVIQGLNSESSKAELESSLLSVRGVVSFLIDLFQQRAVVRSVAPAEEIIASIHSTTSMHASVADNDEDVTKENNTCNSPKYLEDKKSTASWGWGSIISFGSKPAPAKRAPTRPGQQDNSSWWKVW